MNSGTDALNKMIIESNGFLNLGTLVPGTFGKDHPLSSLTLDYSLDDDLKITKNRFEIGINGTIFNKDTGYIRPDVRPPENMPIHDPNIPSRLQIFISNYFLDSLVRSYFEKQFLYYDLFAADFPNHKLVPF